MSRLFRIETLPPVVFVTGDREERLALSACGGRIQAIADQVAGHFAPGEPVGLIFRSGPDLVLAWLGVLHAGRVPCVLQYPTEKLNKGYWRDSIQHTMAVCGIRGLVHAPELAEAPGENLLLAPGETPLRADFPEAGSILQLSSGTTGYKKGVAFSFEHLASHMEAYNQVLGLDGTDCIVSWLPLYHDMGFVACFLLPLMLGVPIVMMDPMVWVARPALLLEAAAAHGGTTCFMPNFAFEVLAKAGGPRCPSMKRWISCSETVYLETFEKFQAATGADPSTLFACYAMAENVFAVTQSRGLEVVEVDGVRHVSCGRPIPGTHLKVVDGEILVRSPHSLHAYAGGEDIRDGEGFYPTGDLGLLADGAVVITGRKRDLVNIAGRKFMLNDLDLRMGALFPESAGRIASLARFDAALGTERVLFLVEVPKPWRWAPTAEQMQAIRETTGLESFDCYPVPPAFITKTSSGKINRVETLKDWTLAERAAAPSAGPADLKGDLDAMFGHLDKDRPVGDLMDSMGLVALRMICEDHGVPFHPGMTLGGIVAPEPARVAEPAGEVFSIVALMDGIKLGFGSPWSLVDEAFLDQLSRIVGCPVTFEHLVVPPLPVLLSDLVFHDYFLPRQAHPGFSAVAECLAKIERASLLIVDDEDNFRLPPLCVYPQLDHRSTHSQLEDFLAHRFTRYTLKHHLLPRKPVLGLEITPAAVLEALEDLRMALRKPIMTLAFHQEFMQHTWNWDYHEYRAFQGDEDYQRRPIDLERVRMAIAAYVARHRDACERIPGEGPNRFVMKDPPHFCSFLVNPKAVEWLVNRYDSFCILGLPSSVPFLEKALDRLGKRYFHSPALDPGRDDFDCVIMTGASGQPATTKPVFDLVHAGETAGCPRNLDPEEARQVPTFMVGAPDLLQDLKPEFYDMLPLGNFFLNGGKREFLLEWFHPREQA